MYKLLIADDEALEREGLEMMVNRMFPEQFEFFHAENGRLAIQTAEEKRPDFIFMDIKMPGIQGIEAAREIRSRNPEIKLVLVTAHDYFSYAKEAVSVGVKEYLLKPAKREEVRDILQALIKESQEDKRKRDEELELKDKLSRLVPLAENELTLMLMMDGVLDLDMAYLAELLDWRWDKGFAIVLSFSGRQTKEWDAFLAERKRMYEAVKHDIKLKLPCLVSPMIGNLMAVFVMTPQTGTAFSNRTNAMKWGEYLHGFIESKFGLQAVTGIGSVQAGIEGLRRTYQEAAAAAADPTAIGCIRHYEDIRQESGQAAIAPEEEKRLLDALERHNKEEAYSLFYPMFDRLASSGKEPGASLRDEMTALFISLSRQMGQRTPADMVSRFSGMDNPVHIRQAAVQELERIMENNSREREARQLHAVDRAKVFVSQNYQQDISMEQTAEYVNLSPYYFSKLFKLQTGETFVDYVTRLRIGKAKQMLRIEAFSLKEISYEVGYNDPNYFSRVFKKITGVTPTEYRQQPDSEGSNPC